MIKLVLVLIINILVLMAWGRFLKYLGIFKNNKNIENIIFQFLLIGNILSMTLLFIIYPFLYTITTYFTSSILLSGFLEEVFKIIIFFVMVLSLKLIKEPIEGIILAVSISLGFALGENFLYVFNSGIPVFIYKSFFGLLGNISYSLIWGSIISVRFSTLERSLKSTAAIYAIPVLIVSTLLHGIYNSLIYSSQHWSGLFVVLLTLILIITVYKYVKAQSTSNRYPVKGYRSTVPGLQIGGR